MEFTPFPKLPRLSRDMVVTEKLDGTNASICITPAFDEALNDPDVLGFRDGMVLRAGSRTRWLSADEDNHGFAKWAMRNAEALFGLGEGHHFGEWWGLGIQRGYGLTEKRFSLFNTGRWYGADAPGEEDLEGRTLAPPCCHVVPVLLRGPFNTEVVGHAVKVLARQGSYAAPGFDKPEGVVVYHAAAGMCFKKTCLKDESPKGLQC